MSLFSRRSKILHPKTNLSPPPPNMANQEHRSADKPSLRGEIPPRSMAGTVEPGEPRLLLPKELLTRRVNIFTSPSPVIHFPVEITQTWCHGGRFEHPPRALSRLWEQSWSVREGLARSVHGCAINDVYCERCIGRAEADLQFKPVTPPERPSLC